MTKTTHSGRKAPRADHSERKTPHTAPRADHSEPDDIQTLDTPAIASARLLVAGGTLILDCDPVDGADGYEWQLSARGDQGYAKTTKANRAKLTRYPLAAPGALQIRVRAVSKQALSEWSKWAVVEHVIPDGA